MVTSAPSVPAISARRLLAAISAAGEDATEVAGALGLKELHREGARVPLNAMYELWDRSFALTRDRSLPLAIARMYDVATYSVLGFACATAPNLAVAYARMARFFGLWVGGERVDIHVAAGGQKLVMHHELERSPGRDLAAESSLAKIVFAGRRATGVDIVPAAVSFAHPAPPDASEHRSFFGGPVLFDADAYVIELDEATLALPMRRADPDLAAFFERQAAQLLPTTKGTPCCADRVRGIIADHLPAGPPAEDEVAAALGMSARTMRRRLSDDQTSFRKVLDQVRCTLARTYLEQPGMSVAEVAFLVGFSDVANFHRAFRRWTGSTPGAFKKRKS